MSLVNYFYSTNPRIYFPVGLSNPGRTSVYESNSSGFSIDPSATGYFKRLKFSITNASSGLSVIYDVFLAWPATYTQYGISAVDYDWIYAGTVTVLYSSWSSTGYAEIDYDFPNTDSGNNKVKIFLVAVSFFNSDAPSGPEGEGVPFANISYDLVPTVLGTVNIEGKHTQKYEKVFKVAKDELTAIYMSGNEDGQYQVRVKRVYEESKSSDNINTCYLGAFRENQEQVLAYPNTAHVAFKIQASDQLSGGFPNLSFLMNGKRIFVWDATLNGGAGGWKIITSSNPAWIVVDMLCRPLIDMQIIQQVSQPTGYTWYESYTQNSLTYWICLKLIEVRGIPFERIDAAKFLEWADWCDELVPNATGTTSTQLNGGVSSGATTVTVDSTTNFPSSGDGWIVNGSSVDAFSWTGKTSTTLTGCIGVAQNPDNSLVYYADGTEKRCEFNGEIASEMRLWEAITMAAQAGRAVIVLNGTKFTVAYDGRQTPTQLFTVGNIGLDSFEVSYLSMDDRATSLEIQYDNKDKDYEGDIITLDNPDSDLVQNKVSFGLPGITSWTQATREAYYRMNLNRALVRSVKFTADIDAIACTIGDVIMLQHDVPEWGFGGRIISATSITVTLDRSIALNIGAAYSIMVRLSSTDVLVEKSLVNPNDGLEHSTFTVSSSYSTVPVEYDLYTLGQTATYQSLYRVSGIQKTGDLKATISAIEYVDSIYDGDVAIVYSEPHAEITYMPEIYEVFEPSIVA